MYLYRNLFAALFLLTSEHDQRAIEVNEYLKRFGENSAHAMKEEPQRWDAQGREIKQQLRSRFSTTEIQNGAARKAKSLFRSQVCMDVAGVKTCLGPSKDLDIQSVIRGNDNPNHLVDLKENSLIRSLVELQTRGLESAKVALNPWSDSYWPAYRGILGTRYADPEFPYNRLEDEGKNWKVNFDYILQHPANSIIKSRDMDAIDLLSPSEKYDMLTGDTNTALTRALWKIGEEYYKTSGLVEEWIGICHGWAQAAMMLPRPRKVLTLLAADQKTPIQFYPADIKALGSLLWAKGKTSIRFIGGRCDVQDPDTDANGRVIDPDCFDTNPGTWHLSVTNQIGISRRSLLMDAMFDYEVWNEPIVSYKYYYFNPQALQYVDQLSDARVSMKDFTQDRFRIYRSPAAVEVAGIVMDITYVTVARPKQRVSDAIEWDDFRTVRYYYDLEMDESGKVIGGEWYNNKHPDFLWVPKLSSHAQSVAEEDAVGEWKGQDDPLPGKWRRAARRAAKLGQPLGKIVEQMVVWTQQD